MTIYRNMRLSEKNSAIVRVPKKVFILGNEGGYFNLWKKKV